MPDTYDFYYPPRRNDVLLVLFSGLVVSGLSVALAWLAGTYLIAGPICGDSAQGLCAAPFTLGYNVFLIIAALVMTTWFVRGHIFRPALIALAPVIMFWSLPLVFSGLVNNGLIIFALLSTLLVAFSYLVFYWLVRINSFFIVLVMWVAVVLGLRFLLTY